MYAYLHHRITKSATIPQAVIERLKADTLDEMPPLDAMNAIAGVLKSYRLLT